MTLQQMEYVLAVDRHRHFGKAAEACHVTQPTLSSMIQKLEEELDAKLFDRARSPVRPTPLGELVIRQLREVMAQVGAVRDVVVENRHSLAGTFRLGILPTIAPYLLPRFFPQLRRDHPEMDIRAREMKTSEVLEALAAGDIDAAIVATVDGLDEFEQTPLFYEAYLGYVSRSSPLFGGEKIRTADLAESKELWLLGEGHCFRDQMVRFCHMTSARTSQLAYNLGSMETFMRMVESGIGVTFIPALAAEQLGEAQRELVRPFAIPVPTRQVVLLTSRHFVRLALLGALVGSVRASVPPGMLRLDAAQTLV